MGNLYKKSKIINYYVKKITCIIISCVLLAISLPFSAEKVFGQGKKQTPIPPTPKTNLVYNGNNVENIFDDNTEYTTDVEWKACPAVSYMKSLLFCQTFFDAFDTIDKCTPGDAGVLKYYLYTPGNEQYSSFFTQVEVKINLPGPNGKPIEPYSGRISVPVYKRDSTGNLAYAQLSDVPLPNGLPTPYDVNGNEIPNGAWNWKEPDEYVSGYLGGGLLRLIYQNTKAPESSCIYMSIPADFTLEELNLGTRTTTETNNGLAPVVTHYSGLTNSTYICSIESASIYGDISDSSASHTILWIPVMVNNTTRWIGVRIPPSLPALFIYCLIHANPCELQLYVDVLAPGSEEYEEYLASLPASTRAKIAKGSEFLFRYGFVDRFGKRCDDLKNLISGISDDVKKLFANSAESELDLDNLNLTDALTIYVSPSDPTAKPNALYALTKDESVKSLPVDFTETKYPGGPNDDKAWNEDSFKSTFATFSLAPGSICLLYDEKSANDIRNDEHEIHDNINENIGNDGDDASAYTNEHSTLANPHENINTGDPLTPTIISGLLTATLFAALLLVWLNIAKYEKRDDDRLY